MRGALSYAIDGIGNVVNLVIFFFFIIFPSIEGLAIVAIASSMCCFLGAFFALCNTAFWTECELCIGARHLGISSEDPFLEELPTRRAYAKKKKDNFGLLQLDGALT
ncbi:unnamed protein product [Vitrella brassicaformis CCMP3155]|uniref:Uncharacterized protein n=1 Tax=Vitrella brassicaformis (strain CCMP3155) TaxID=1169540 RepID=A0A0G4F6Q0_VITBC|nr:unnamed protein product [Vitrella brassicaformis CCMP3155]|eukprot:CEM08102.1 unnamed protein product [Vitrella brassicaformis CCMP3155]